MNRLEIVGARKHNLQDLCLNIPKNKLVVITGVSGSGKSSLAYDTVFQEGQSRYLVALSTYARHFLKGLERTEVRAIRGIAPTIAVDQKHAASYFQSTVGTVSGVTPYLRLLMARAGEARCPGCGEAIARFPAGRIIPQLLERHQGQTVQLFAPVVKNRRGGQQALLGRYVKLGFLKALVDGQEFYLDAVPPLDPGSRHTIAIQIDVLAISSSARTQLAESVRLALHEGRGELLLRAAGETRIFSGRLYCSDCDVYLPEPQPGIFSFQSPEGACPACSGLGEAGPGRTCSECSGSGLNAQARSFYFHGRNMAHFGEMEISDLGDFFSRIEPGPVERAILAPLLPQIRQRLDSLLALSLGYLALGRRVRTLSGGELQRARLVSQIGFSLNGIIYVLDEPSIGMHMGEQRNLIRLLRRLQEGGNTVIVVEHDAETIRSADWIVELGPGAGDAGGRLAFSGRLDDFLKSGATLTAAYLTGSKKIGLGERRKARGFIEIRGVSVHNVHELDLRIPVNALTVVAGVSGSGKSSLVADALYPILHSAIAGKPLRGGAASFSAPPELGGVRRVLMVGQEAIGRNSRSCPATYIGLMPPLQQLFAALPEARVRGYGPGRFSFNVGGRCPACAGLGSQKVAMGLLPHLEIVCPVCRGKRYDSETLEVKYRGHAIADVLEMTAGEALALFAQIPPAAQKLQVLVDVGLGYLRLGQSCLHLSGGESQRIKLTRELAKTVLESTLYILDEPTVGLHFDDIRQLLAVFAALLGRGHTLVVIEHNPALIRSADHLIELGPGGGRNGGRIVYQGPVEGVLACPDSITGRFLQENPNGI